MRKLLKKQMTQLNQIYKCEICGNIVEILHAGAGELVCCEKAMNIQSENFVEASLEKHLPTLNKNNGLTEIKIGSEEHPMTEDHYIEWIEAQIDDKYIKVFLSPGQKPQISLKLEGENISAKAYCNLHGLWKYKKN
jgi:superoxide reductase